MKKNTKRVLAVLAAAVMTGTLTACGDGAGGQTEKSTTAAASAGAVTGTAASTDAGGKTVINIVKCMNQLATVDSGEVQAVEDAINDYIADKLNVQVNLTEYTGGEYSDKCNLSLANNEINMLWTASWLNAISCDQLYQSNAVYDITDLLQGSSLYDSMPEAVWKASQYGGRNYYIPVYKEIAEGYDLMFRKDLVDKYGWDLSSIKKLEDIEPILEDCANDENCDAPLLTQATYLGSKMMLDDYDFIGGNDMFGVDRSTNEVVNVVGTEQYRELCKLISRWAEKGYILEGDTTKSNPSNALSSKYWGVSWWTDVPNNAEANKRYKQDVEVVHMTGNWIMSNTTLGSCYAISSTCTEEQAKACIDFMGLLYTDTKLADLYTFGIEGTDYERNADDFIVKKGELYNHSAWESCSVRPLSLEEGEPKDKVELVEKFNEAGKTSIAAGFRIDRTPIEAQLAACGNVQDKYGFVLENGGYAEADVDKALEDYQAALDEAGYQEVLAEVTKQYNEWKESIGAEAVPAPELESEGVQTENTAA